MSAEIELSTSITGSPTPSLDIGPNGNRYSVVMLFPGHMLTDHLAYGDGLVAFGFISALARRGHRLHVIAQRAEIKAVLPDNVIIHRVGGAPEHGGGGRLQYILNSRAIVRGLVRLEKIDLVHQLNPVNNGMSVGMLGLDIPLILGTFVAKWPNDKPVGRGALARCKAGLRELACTAVLRFQEHNAAALLLTTPAALSRLSSSDYLADRVHWLPHGIDMAAFAPLPPTSYSDKTILFLASVAVKKGIFKLLEAFEIVLRSIPDARLVIAGDGPAFEQMRCVVRELPSVSRIDILGPVHRAVVPRLMANAAVYCLPSYGEPYATTVIEAMACAKPIVVTDSGGINYMIDDAGGRRVRTGDAEALAQALIEILGAPDLAQRMGEHNRAVVERDYDWPRVIERLEGIYRSVIVR